MPWRDVRPMDEKLLFLADYLRDVGTFSRLCERYGISRKTGYKWVARYREAGLNGLSERSRRPLHAGQGIPVTIRQAILELRSGQRDPRGRRRSRPCWPSASVLNWRPPRPASTTSSKPPARSKPAGNGAG